jgi:UDP-glucuronate decarboxylase
MTQAYLESDIAEIVKRLGASADELAGKTMLLTGGRGFLGRYFQAVIEDLNRGRLKSNPCQLLLLDNLITAGELGKGPVRGENTTFIEHDVIKPFKYRKKIHYVVHAAGIASPFYYRAYPLNALDVAIQGTRHMLDLAHKNNARFSFFSSSEIYGDPDPRHIPIPESYRGNVSSQGPRACYDESKRVGETLCYIYHNSFGVTANTIRPFNVFGPGMQATDYRVLPNFAHQIKTGAPLNIYGTGQQTRTFCYVTDAIVGFMLVFLHGVPGEAYNIGNPKPELSVLDLAKRIEGVLERKIDYRVIEHPDSYPADEPNRRCPDIRKAQLQLEYTPQVDFDEGLRRFLEWTDANYEVD